MSSWKKNPECPYFHPGSDAFSVGVLTGLWFLSFPGRTGLCLLLLLWEELERHWRKMKRCLLNQRMKRRNSGGPAQNDSHCVQAFPKQTPPGHNVHSLTSLLWPLWKDGDWPRDQCPVHPLTQQQQCLQILLHWQAQVLFQACPESFFQESSCGRKRISQNGGWLNHF